MVIRVIIWCGQLKYRPSSLLCVSQRLACPPSMGEPTFISSGCGKKPYLAPFSFDSSFDDGGIVSQPHLKREHPLILSI